MNDDLLNEVLEVSQALDAIIQRFCDANDIERQEALKLFAAGLSFLQYLEDKR